MRFDDLYISGAAAHVPGRRTVEEAVAAGECDARTAERAGLLSVAVSDGASAPEMAVRAARPALDRSGAGPGEVQLLLHADVYYQGHDLWAPASYIQRQVLGGGPGAPGATGGPGNRCPAVELRQLSNGGMAAMELAARALAGDPAGHSALLTTGDRFCAPGFDRWRSDPGTVYGDAGTALVLTRGRGFARLLSLVTVSEPELEGMHRGNDPFGVEPFSLRKPLDAALLKKEHLAEAGVSTSAARVSAGQSETLKRTLAEADVGLTDIDWFLLPHFGLRRLTQSFLRRWSLDTEVTTWSYARTVGHLGAGDQFASLAHLAGRGVLLPGQRCLLAGVGAGFTWTCAVLEIQRTPRWNV